jgi:DNA-binding transcriptional LysR family regulator
VRSALGIAALPDFLAAEAPELVRVLPEVDGPDLQAYFVFPEELRHSRRLIVFRDFVIRKVAETRF